MTLRAILAGALLLASNLVQVHANPIGPIPSPGPGVYFELHLNTTLTTQGHEQHCNINGYTFDNQGSDASPTIADCNQIVTNIDKDGLWRVAEDTQHQLVQYHTCAWGIEPVNHPSLDIVGVGNGDIIYTITESIKRFGQNEGHKIGASGTMWCQKMTDIIDGQWAKMKWGIYHNSQPW